MLSVFPPGSPGSCSARSSVSATSTCLEESKFLAPAPYASPSPFPFLDSSRIWTTSPGSPRSFSASSSVSATSSSSKEGSSWLDKSKKFAPAPYASSTFCLFSESSCPRPPSCVSTRFFSVSSFFTTPSAGGPFYGHFVARIVCGRGSGLDRFRLELEDWVRSGTNRLELED